MLGTNQWVLYILFLDHWKQSARGYPQLPLFYNLPNTSKPEFRSSAKLLWKGVVHPHWPFGLKKCMYKVNYFSLLMHEHLWLKILKQVMCMQEQRKTLKCSTPDGLQQPQPTVFNTKHIYSYKNQSDNLSSTRKQTSFNHDSFCYYQLLSTIH